MESKRIFRLLFLNLGISSLLFQTLLLRELVVSFYGNEFFVGVVLALWLFWTAVGSFVSGKILHPPAIATLKRWRASLLIAPHIFISFLIPALILFIRFFEIPGTTGGEIPDFFTSLIFVAAILAPVGLSFGSIFTLGVKMWPKASTAYFRSNPDVHRGEERKEDSKGGYSFGRNWGFKAPSAKPQGGASGAGVCYFWEILGFILAGLVFSFFLVTAPALPVAFLISALNLALVSLLLPKGSKLPKTLCFTLGLLLVFFSVFCGKEIEFASQRWRFPNLVHQENSLYGHIAVTKSEDQHNFYESGLLVGADEDYYGSEFLVHPTLLQHSNPRQVLLIGGGWNGVLAEILKYPSVEKIDYVELDPQFLRIVEKYLSEDLKKAFSDPRAQKHFVDGRFFLKNTNETYDVVIFNLPNPSTALINRFYTKECFEEVKRITHPTGVFALPLSTPTDYLSAETENLLASVYKTLKREFPQVQILAEENVLFLAAKDADAKNAKVSKVLKHWKDLKLKTAFLTEAELEYRLTSDKNARVQRSLETNKEAKLNSDFYPAAYFYQTLFWQTKFSFLFAKILASLQQPLFWVLVSLLLSAFGLLFVWRKPSLLSTSNVAVLTVGLGGLTLMAMEIILIFLFQTILGFVYSRIALLMALILAGLALGNFVARRFLRTVSRGLLLAQILIVFYLFSFLQFIPHLTSEIHFYILGIAAGVLVGLIFPLASDAKAAKGDAKNAKNAGLLYAADLTGSFFGALLPSLFLIPLFGVGSTITFLLALNLIGTLLLLRRRFGR